MRHIVIIPDSVKSKRISAIELARRLHKAGYKITIIGSGGNYSQIDTFDYHRVDLKLNSKTKAPPATYLKYGKAGRWIWQIKNLCTLQTEVVEVPKLNSFNKLMDDLAPDLVLLDVEVHPYILSTISKKLPVALFSVFFNLWKCKGMPTLHSEVIPGRGLAGKPLFIELQWLRFRLWKWALHKKNFIVYGGMDWLSVNRCYAESLGLRLDQHVDMNQWLIPFLYKDLPTLVLNPYEMEFNFSKPDNVTYVGPMTCIDRKELPFLPETGEQLSKLEIILEQYRNKRSDKRLIYCSFGAYFAGDDTQFLKRLIRSLQKTDWDVIIALGNRMNPEKLGKMPENILCIPFAAQMEILSVADCAVIHGGMTTVYECIHHSVPMVAYPFKVNDQLGTAARVSYHGLGQVGNRNKDSASKIFERVEETMSDQLIQENINRMRHKISKYADGRIAAEAVDAIINEYRSSI